MLNQSGVTKTSAGTRKTILYDTKLFFALSIKVSDSGVELKDGKKIVKAGTILAGDKNDRDTAFTVATGKTDVVAILEHDVDVTSGEANGSAIFFGFIDESKLDNDVKEKLTTDVKSAIPAIQFFD